MGLRLDETSAAYILEVYVDHLPPAQLVLDEYDYDCGFVQCRQALVSSATVLHIVSWRELFDEYMDVSLYNIERLGIFKPDTMWNLQAQVAIEQNQRRKADGIVSNIHSYGDSPFAPLRMPLAARRLG